MIQIICGEKGKGKTKVMLEKSEASVKTTDGFVVYIDKSSKHMLDLNNKIRLINIKDYQVDTFAGFIGFVSGLIAGNHDIVELYIDSFIKVAHVDETDLATAVNTLDSISSDVNFVLSISVPKEEIPQELQEKIVSAC